MKEQTLCLEKIYDFKATRPLEGAVIMPDNVIAVGNPCKVLREVNEHDREYYFKDRKIAAEISALCYNYNVLCC